MSTNRPSVLIAAAKYWPLSARLAMALIRHGCIVSAICPRGHPLHYISGVKRIHRYAGIHSLASLQRAMSESGADVVIPCDDGVVTQLHELHSQESSVRDLIERSLGPPESFCIVGSRFKFLSASAELGIDVPKTIQVTKVEDLQKWHQHFVSAGVLKVDGECGGNGVRISHSLDESIAAWRALSARPRPATVWKRLAIEGDSLAIWRSKNPADREVTIQEYVVGRPANSMLACYRGKLLSVASVAVVVSDGVTGGALIVRRIASQRMAEIAALIATRLQLTGFYGLDFMIDARTDIPYLIELNPRCTQLGHLEFADQASLAASFSAALRGEPSPKPEYPIEAETISFFPQALAAGGACAKLIRQGYHDVPWTEPRLASELLLGPWPQRQWAARLYHTLRPLQRPTPVLFENAGFRASDETQAKSSTTLRSLVPSVRRAIWK